MVWDTSELNKYTDEDNIIMGSAIINFPGKDDIKTSVGIKSFKECNAYYLLLKEILNYGECK